MNLLLIGRQLKSQTRARIDHSWASQTAILNGYSKLVYPDYLLRVGTYENLTSVIVDQLDLSRIRAGEILLEGMAFQLAEIYDEELEQLVAKAYARDYLDLKAGGTKPPLIHCFQ